MVGNPILKPGGGTYDHVQDLGNILRGLRNSVDALKNATLPDAVAARQAAQQAIQQIEQAIQGAGLWTEDNLSLLPSRPWTRKKASRSCRRRPRRNFRCPRGIALFGRFPLKNSAL